MKLLKCLATAEVGIRAKQSGRRGDRSQVQICRPDMVDVLRPCAKEPKDRRRTSVPARSVANAKLSRYRRLKGYEAWHARRC